MTNGWTDVANADVVLVTGPVDLREAPAIRLTRPRPALRDARPIPVALRVAEGQRIAGLVCFYNERVDLLVDGELQARPRTKFS